MAPFHQRSRLSFLSAVLNNINAAGSKWKHSTIQQWNSSCSDGKMSPAEHSDLWQCQHLWSRRRYAPSEGELPPRQLPHSPSELLRGNHKNRKKHSESPWKLLTSFASQLQTLAGSPEEEIIRKNSEKNKKAKSVQMCSCRGGSDGRRVNLSPFWNPDDASVQQWWVSAPLSAGASVLYQYSQNYRTKKPPKRWRTACINLRRWAEWFYGKFITFSKTSLKNVRK